MNVFGLEPVYGRVEAPQVGRMPWHARARLAGEALALLGLVAMAVLAMRR